MDSASSNGLIPLHKAQIEIGLTVTFTIFYSCLFIAAYAQLWLVLYLNHKKVSTQTVYFFLCCSFTGLRVVLFSFFYHDFKISQDMSFLTYWLLLCLPVIIQYTIVLTITNFYYRTYYRINEELKLYKRRLLYNSIVLEMLVIIINSLPMNLIVGKSDVTAKSVAVGMRVLLTDLVFIGTIIAFVYVYRQFPKFPNARLVIEVKRVTYTRTVVIGILSVSLVLVKLIYDLLSVALMFKDTTLHFPIVLEVADINQLYSNIWAFIVFGSLLFFWEVVPLIAIMIVFHVKLPAGFFKRRLPTSQQRVVIGAGGSLQSNSASSSHHHSHNATLKSNFIAVPKRPFYGTMTSPSDSGGALSPQYYSPAVNNPSASWAFNDHPYRRLNNQHVSNLPTIPSINRPPNFSIHRASSNQILRAK